ncbi:MAG: amylo-alpha-1,6-glucosidase [Burkholderiales bacterium]
MNVERPEKDDYSIIARASRAAERTRVLKHGDTFAVFDSTGDILPSAWSEQGLYHDGTRFLCHLELLVNGRRPLLLSSTVRQDNDLFVVDLTNPDMSAEGSESFPGDILHIFRSSFLWQGACYHQIRISNYGLTSRQVSLTLQFAADYADIFEVRGTHRQRRGQLSDARTEDGELTFGYVGLDGVRRTTRISFASPVRWRTGTADLATKLEPQSHTTVVCTIACEVAGERHADATHDDAFAVACNALTRAKSDHCHIETSSGLFNDWVRRSMADLQMMITPTPSGLYPYAGVPWFNAPFGRDGIITALELLWLYPAVARGVLGFLAATQALETVPEQDAQPGKILHEMRGGEMAALGEIPFGRYYGSVDATPLFVLLAGAYYERTGDIAFIESIWPAIDRALRWIDIFGDADGDGFVEYLRQTPDGLVQQGWKDSQDSIFHADGRIARPPIALCEVQAYVYAARRYAAALARALGMDDRAAHLGQQAETLREHFERAFWDDQLSTYVLALEGDKRPCRVRASNAGHTLFGGIASAERAARLANVLLDENMYSGWGIRTLASGEVRYNPMSYHNGSVWPHDNALTAAGFGRYALTSQATRVLEGLYDSSGFLDLHRLPELFCGFRRRPAEGPTLYPVACAPQSWAAGSTFMLLQGCLGLSVDGLQKRVTFTRARLPERIASVRITNLRVGDGAVDLLLERHLLNVAISVLKTTGDVEIVTVKG